MVLELHVWGPAFSLPSIDSQCIAAIAYMTQAVPRGEWTLIASSDPSPSPTSELPAIRNENVWIGGFRNIVDFVAQYSGNKWCLDAGLEGKEKADCIAFSSFIEMHGQPLIDLSLYVSTNNYTNVTRPLYSTIQSFPLSYTTPSSIRTAAKSRTSHLGLSTLDIDSHMSDSQKDESAIPPSLRKTRTTISSLLSQNPENAAQIRLDALATSFFEPLQSLRGKKRYFISQYPTSLDCLAFGYLSLALLPDLPSPWLANTMRTKYPQLCAFVHDLQRSYFNGPVSLEEAYPTASSDFPSEGAETEMARRKQASGKAALPWSAPESGSVLAIGGILASSVADNIPVISQFRHVKRLERELDSAAEDEQEKYEVTKVVSAYRRDLWTATAAVIGSIGLMLGYMFHHGLLEPYIGGHGQQSQSFHGSSSGHDNESVIQNSNGNIPEPESATGLENLGDLGQVLANLPEDWPMASPMV